MDYMTVLGTLGNWQQTFWQWVQTAYTTPNNGTGPADGDFSVTTNLANSLIGQYANDETELSSLAASLSGDPNPADIDALFDPMIDAQVANLNAIANGTTD